MPLQANENLLNHDTFVISIHKVRVVNPLPKHFGESCDSIFIAKNLDLDLFGVGFSKEVALADLKLRTVSRLLELREKGEIQKAFPEKKDSDPIREALKSLRKKILLPTLSDPETDFQAMHELSVMTEPEKGLNGEEKIALINRIKKERPEWRLRLWLLLESRSRNRPYVEPDEKEFDREMTKMIAREKLAQKREEHRRLPGQGPFRFFNKEGR